jgi:transcriptional regulator with XRE-family HTH domain
MLGNRIKDYLDEKGIKYSFISGKTGIPMNILSPMLNEKREIKAVEYFEICNALGVSLETFADNSCKKRAV